MTGWRRLARIAVEMAASFGMLAGLDWWLTGGTGFADVQPNPFWIPVLAMALAYGTGPGVVAATVASSQWLMHVHEDAAGRDYLDYLFHLSLPPLMWFVAAVAVGEVTIVRTARQARLVHRGRAAARNVARMTEAFDALSRTNRLLQVQIATEGRTVGHVIDTATRLSAADPAERRAAIVHLIAMAARTDDFTCYRLVGEDARAWLRGPVTAGRPEILSHALLGRVLGRRRVLHVARPADRTALAGVGVAAIGLYDADSGRLVGCLVCHALPFAALGAGRLAELGEVASWLAPLLADALRTTPRSTRPAGLVA